MDRVTRLTNTLKSRGVPITLRSVPVSSKYDPITGGYTEVSVDEPRYGLLLDILSVRPLNGFGRTSHEASDVDRTKKWALMDSVGSVPKMQDKIVHSTSVYEIVNVQTVSDGPIAVLYILQIKN